MINKLLSFFEVRERKSMLSVEIVAGITTFMTMSYIIFLQPNILAGLMPGAQPTGMDREALLVTTCIAAAVGSILMGLLANYPIALDTLGGSPSARDYLSKITAHEDCICIGM